MSALGKTAAITLLTGIPGSGKSLRVVQFMKQAIDAGELLYVCNFDGTLRLPHIKFEDARQWQDVPAGAVLVVDEAQDFFRARRSGEPPAYILAMERIRKMGVRLILTTQQPDYLDTHLRGLVGLHEHLLRVDGKEQSQIFRNNEVIDNVRSKKSRAAHDTETWDFPSDLYGLYDSAQVHTVKRVMASRVKRGLIMAGIAAVLVVAVVYLVGRKGAAALENDPAGGSSAPPRPSAAVPADRQGARIREVSAIEKHEAAALAEYFANLKPRNPTLPWSAPAFDGRGVQSEPRAFCMVSGAGIDASGEHREASYTCITEQGTRVVVPSEGYAQLLARWGEPYNPFKAPVEQHAAAMPKEYESEPHVARRPALGVGGTEIKPASYGGMRETGWQ